MLLLERSKCCNSFCASRKAGNLDRLHEDNHKYENLGRVELMFAFETNTLLPERSSSWSSLSLKKVFNSTLPFRLIEERDSLCSLVKLTIDLRIDSFILFSLNPRACNGDKELFWNLRGTMSWFWSRYSIDNEGIVNKTEGMASVSELWDKTRVDKLESLPISDRIDPFNWFP